MLKLFTDKNRDYGDTFRKDGLVGTLVREHDKLSRALVISQDGYQISVKDEKLRDTLLDAANYMIMAVISMDEVKRGKEEGTDSGNQQEQLQQNQDDYPSFH